jgi:hypothetical protein
MSRRSVRVDSVFLLRIRGGDTLYLWEGGSSSTTCSTKHHHGPRGTLRRGGQDALAIADTLTVDVAVVNAHNPIAGDQFAGQGTVHHDANDPNMIVGGSGFQGSVSVSVSVGTANIHSQTSGRELNANQLAITVLVLEMRRRRRHGCCLDLVATTLICYYQSKE